MSLSNPTMSPAPDQDQGAYYLTMMIREHIPFLFLRFGDGFLECVAGKKGMTCDLEPYAAELANELIRIWKLATSSPLTILGDWQSAKFTPQDEYSRYSAQWDELMKDAHPQMVRIHFESLLLMRESSFLVDFYRTVKEDSRKKLFMGPEGNRGAAEMLGADFLPTPMSNLMAWKDDLRAELLRRDFDILLYGAGMAGNIPVVDCWTEHPERTYVNLGSAMDILFRGRSRRQQIAADVAKRMFQEKGLL